MSSPVSLDDFIEAVQIMPYECESYVNKTTGEVVTFSDDIIRAIEEKRDLDYYPEWQQIRIKEAEAFFADNTTESIFIPNNARVRDYNLMKEYCYGIQDYRFRDKLLRLIRGSGAFRRFKNALIERGIEKDWYRYQSKAHKENAIEWLERHGIAYEDDVRPIK